MSADHFADPSVVARYLDGPQRTVPGLTVMHDLVDQLLAEAVPDQGRVLVVGAGGGLELVHLADRHPTWSFDGVDPSLPMLDLAHRTVGSSHTRVALYHGDVSAAPEGPFDGATCLLTLHFLPEGDRLATLKGIRQRLGPGAPLLTFHHSVPAGPDRLTWLERTARYAAGADGVEEKVRRGAQQLAGAIPILTPEQDEALLGQAGFAGIATFYSALTFRGWRAVAS